MGKLTAKPGGSADKLHDDKKLQFIELYRQTNGHITNCCSAAGISRTTFYAWLEKDQEFLKSIDDANAELNDDMREALIHKAASGDLGGIIFYLRKRHPEFKDQPTVLIQQNFKEVAAKDLSEFSS